MKNALLQSVQNIWTITINHKIIRITAHTYPGENEQLIGKAF